jgi:hypothetical protein
VVPVLILWINKACLRLVHLSSLQNIRTSSPGNALVLVHLQRCECLLVLVDGVHHELVDLPIDKQMCSTCISLVRSLSLLRQIVVVPFCRTSLLRHGLIILTVRVVSVVGALIVREVMIRPFTAALIRHLNLM